MPSLNFTMFLALSSAAFFAVTAPSIARAGPADAASKQAEQDPSIFECQGTVVDTVENTLIIRDAEGNNIALAVMLGTHITLDGQPAAFGDLARGQTVVATGRMSADQMVAVTIAAVSNVEGVQTAEPGTASESLAWMVHLNLLAP